MKRVLCTPFLCQHLDSLQWLGHTWYLCLSLGRGHTLYHSPSLGKGHSWYPCCSLGKGHTSQLCSSLGRALPCQRGFGAVPVGVEGSRPGQEELLARSWGGQVAACYRAQHGSWLFILNAIFSMPYIIQRTK